MIETLNIENFRCFKNLNLTELKNFNLIVGESGSGKTALLEAIFLVSAASPEVWLRLRQWRGAGGQLRLTGTRSSYEAVFRDIFFNFDKHTGASFRLVDEYKAVRSLEINYPREAGLKRRSKGSPAIYQENAFLIEPIQFVWRARSREYRSKVDYKEGILRFSGHNYVYPAWFSSPAVNDSAVVAPLFSELSIKKQTSSLINAIRNAFPVIEDITLESIAGEPTLCASVSSLGEKIPVGAISSGLNKYLSIMVAAAANSGGILLIDEFEVGFYYRTLPKLLTSIVQFCAQQDVQIVATTHSYEFLQAFLPVMKSEAIASSFSLMRSEREADRSTIKVLTDPISALESSFEVR